MAESRPPPSGAADAWSVGADRLEETGHARAAWYCRWRAATPELLCWAAPQDDDYGHCVTLEPGFLPDGLADFLPPGVIDWPRTDVPPELLAGDRITGELWCDLAGCEADLLAAWLAWWRTLLQPAAFAEAMLAL